MLNVVYWLPAQADRLGPKVGSHLALLLHSSREPVELSQCFKHDDSTIKIILASIYLFIVIIINIISEQLDQ